MAPAEAERAFDLYGGRGVGTREVEVRTAARQRKVLTRDGQRAIPHVNALDQGMAERQLIGDAQLRKRTSLTHLAAVLGRGDERQQVLTRRQVIDRQLPTVSCRSWAAKPSSSRPRGSTAKPPPEMLDPVTLAISSSRFWKSVSSIR